MGKIVDYYNVSVIHAQGIHQLVVAFLASKIFSRRKKIGIVVSTHSTLAGSSYENATLFIESLVLNICADLVLPVAKSVANQLVNFGLIPNKAVIIYNGIDLKLLDEIVYSDEPTFPWSAGIKSSSHRLIGYFARLVPNKGHAHLIKAISEVAREYPNVNLLLAGDGPLRRQMEGLAKRLGIEKRILFTGKVGHKTIYKILKEVDIYAFPSSAELFPYAILEAMAAGKPIVATNVGGVPEVIKDGETGLLIQPRNPKSIADGIRTLITNPMKAEQMGKKCRKLIEKKFALRKIAHDLTRCYELAIRRKTL